MHTSEMHKQRGVVLQVDPRRKLSIDLRSQSACVQLLFSTSFFGIIIILCVFVCLFVIYHTEPMFI